MQKKKKKKGERRGMEWGLGRERETEREHHIPIRYQRWKDNRIETGKKEGERDREMKKDRKGGRKKKKEQVKTNMSLKKKKGKFSVSHLWNIGLNFKAVDLNWILSHSNTKFSSFHLVWKWSRSVVSNSLWPHGL